MNALIRIFSFLSIILVYTSAQGYDGYKIVDLTPSTQEQCDLLHKLSSTSDELYDFFLLSRRPLQPSRVMVKQSAADAFVSLLHEHEISYEMVNTDVGASVAEEFNRMYALRRSTAYTAGSGRLGTDRYHTHAEINAYIHDLSKLYPTRVLVKTIGKSYERRQMNIITITNGDRRANKNVILVDGGIHAREWISPASVLYVIEQLVENAEENAALLLDYDWVILPVVNPDGYEHTQTSRLNRLWRKTRQPNLSSGNCIGVDPNRNFAFKWMVGGASSDPCSETFAGAKPFSESETVVLRDLMFTLQGRGVMYLTVHSYGNYLLYPWGYAEELPETWEDLHEVCQVGADAIFRATGTNYTVGSSATAIYIAAGASDDYAFAVADFPISVTMELPGGGLTGFDPPASSIDRLVKETWIGIRAMAERVVQKYPLNWNTKK